MVLLDLGLPDVDGVDVCREIRAACDVPVIVVSARGEVDDRIQGLHCGADDYLVKPYDTGELLARMHAVLRRRAPARRAGRPGDVVAVADVRVDLRRHEVTVAGNRSRSPARSSRSSRCSRRRRHGVHPRADRRRGVGPHAGRARTGPSTCTWRRCAPSSAARSWWRRCAGSATGSAPPTGQPARPRPRSRGARGCW